VRKTSSYTGPAKQAHGEVEAERMLAAGLRILGVEPGELAELPKGMPEKRVLAWWLRQQTTVGRQWIGERLGMGDESGVSKSIRLVKEGPEAELVRMRNKLLKRSNEDG